MWELLSEVEPFELEVFDANFQASRSAAVWKMLRREQLWGMLRMDGELELVGRSRAAGAELAQAYDRPVRPSSSEVAGPDIDDTASPSRYARVSKAGSSLLSAGTRAQ